MSLFYLALLTIALLLSLVDVLIFKWLFKKINIPSVSYKKNLFISILTKIIIILVTFVAPPALGDTDVQKIVYWFLASLVLSFLTSYVMFSKYYKIDIVQAFLIFISHLIFVILLLGVPYEIRFFKEILYINTGQSQKIVETCSSRPNIKWICEPSLICEYDPGCTSVGLSACLADSSCRSKTGYYNYH